MQDKVMPKGKWKFDKEVTECFDDMLNRSIPNYEEMRKLVTKLGLHFCVKDSWIVDIGCSEGSAIAPFISKLGKNNKYMLLDKSKPMIEQAKVCMFGMADVIQHTDITENLPKCEASLYLSILTLQFIPIEHRQHVLKNIYNNLIDGGALIIVEKVLGNTFDIDDILVDEYYQLKKENLYTQEQIKAKRKSLEGVLVPLTENWNISLLRETGFKKIDCFWRYLNFAGWIAIK